MSTKPTRNQSDAPHIVAIDDDTSVLTLLEVVLGDYRVTTFDSPQDAVEAFKKGLDVDLIVCDISMPSLSGFELHEEVRRIVALRSVPFLYLTALADRRSFRRGMEQGADDYITKPFTPHELRDAVRVRLERAGILRDSLNRELTITSLGGLGVMASGHHLQWEAAKAIELLLFLLASGPSTLGEARSALWWQSPNDNHLHVLINRLRKTLGELASVEVEGDALTLRYEGGYRWDVDIFEASAKRALEERLSSAVETAIGLYGGAFLPGFDSPWSERRRGHYEDLYVELLQLSVELARNETVRRSAETRLQAFLE